MVYITASLVGAAALLSSTAFGIPIPDSSINEPGVASPNGTPVTLTGGASAATPTPNAKDSSSSSSSAYMGGSSAASYYSSSSSDYQATSTSSSAYSSSTAYGSGYSNWNSGYSSCVQQCMNSYSPPPPMYTPPPSSYSPPSSKGDSSSSSGKVITIYVAPMQGVLRFVPFAVNASAGDTVRYVWGANNHTVTRSSILEPCNKTAGADTFATGVQQKDFSFDLTVNDTNTVPFYCGVPGHCEKGMFGYINPPNAGGAMSVSTMMNSYMSNNTALATQAMYVQMKSMNTSAWSWGQDMDMSQVPADKHEAFLQNVLNTRLFLAANSGSLLPGQGAAVTQGQTVAFPPFDALANAAAAPSNGTAPAASAPAVPSPASSSSSSPSPSASADAQKKNGAMSKGVASSAFVGVASLVALALTL